MGLYTLITITLVAIIFVQIRKVRRERKAKESVENEFKELAFILESLDDGLIECDLNMNVKRMNPAAERLLGTPASDIVGKKFANTPTGSNIEQLMSKILYSPTRSKSSTTSAPGTSVHEVATGDKSGKRLRITTTTKINPETKQPTGYLKILHDISPGVCMPFDTKETTPSKEKPPAPAKQSFSQKSPPVGFKNQQPATPQPTPQQAKAVDGLNKASVSGQPTLDSPLG